MVREFDQFFTFTIKLIILYLEHLRGVTEER